METLTPSDAALVAGVPPAQLVRWAHDDWDVTRRRAAGVVGPRNTGTRYKPRYRREDVLAWRAKYEGADNGSHAMG